MLLISRRVDMEIKHSNAESGKMWENYRLGFIFPFSFLCRSLPLFVLWKTIFFHVISISPPWHHVSSPCQFHVTPWDGLSRKKVARMDRDRYFVPFFRSLSSSSFLPSFPIFFFLFFLLFPSFSSGFEGFLGLVALDLPSALQADAIHLSLDLTSYFTWHYLTR